MTMTSLTGLLQRKLRKAVFPHASVKLLTQEELEEAMFSDERRLLKHTCYACEKSVQRAILELCAFKFRGSSRRRLVRVHDDLCRQVLRPRGHPFHRALKQRWYKDSDRGQRQVVQGLYTVIRANPQTFLQMLAN